MGWGGGLHSSFFWGLRLVFCLIWRIGGRVATSTGFLVSRNSFDSNVGLKLNWYSTRGRSGGLCVYLCGRSSTRHGTTTPPHQILHTSPLYNLQLVEEKECVRPATAA